MRRWAFILSHISDPMILLTILTIGAVRYTQSYNQSYGFGPDFFLLIFFCFSLLPTLVLRIWAVRTHRINWDVTDRRKRPKILLLLFIFGLWNLLLVRYFGNVFVFRLFVFYQVWLTGFGLISLRYKLSGHAGAAILMTFFIIQWFGPLWWLMALFTPAIAWARILSREHTLGQVIVGITYSISMIILMQQVYPI